MIEYRSYASPSGWNAIAGNRPPAHALASDTQADFLVIGAGFAGLAAARTLAQRHPGHRIVLLEAGQAGENSSGRNSGFMIDLPYAKISAANDPAQRAWQTRLLRYGKTLLENIVQAHGIRCGWHESGHYKAATTFKGADALRALCETLRVQGVEFRALAPQDIRRELGSSHYRAAIWLPSCALVQPAELVNGLIAALPANVEAFFETPVDGLTGKGPYEAHARGHSVTARHVLLCVNTALPAFGHGRYRQLSMYTYAGLTRLLSDSEAALFGDADDWGITPVERLEATSRLVAGKRYMLRAGFSYKHELQPEKVRELLASKLAERHPELGMDVFEHVWGGAVSLTRNDAPLFEQLGQRLYAISGCNASGILKMTALGALLAAHVSGEQSALLAETQALSKPRFIPPDPFRRIAVHLNIHKFQRELAGDKT